MESNPIIERQDQDNDFKGAYSEWVEENKEELTAEFEEYQKKGGTLTKDEYFSKAFEVYYDNIMEEALEEE